MGENLFLQYLYIWVVQNFYPAKIFGCMVYCIIAIYLYKVCTASNAIAAAQISGATNLYF